MAADESLASGWRPPAPAGLTDDQAEINRLRSELNEQVRQTAVLTVVAVALVRRLQLGEDALRLTALELTMVERYKLITRSTGDEIALRVRPI